MNYKTLHLEQLSAIKTLGDLKRINYVPMTIKEELRSNLISKLRNKETVFEGIWGYEETVIPDLERAILSRHHINLLGLRGQAKTKIARLMIHLLDEYIPVVDGSDLNDDPLMPLSVFAQDLINEKGDETPVRWMHKSERYSEKLATPDVSVADLVGDVDPIKAASLKLPYSDPRVIHYGLIPRSNRCILVINELPDLQARIQVALFNILQEGDIQIRGFKLRLPLDIQFVFTANPEDYTNRGSIVTPLKDRIDSQIITHYPKSIEIGKRITQQEAKLKPEQIENVVVPDLIKDLIEQVAFEARKSEYVDAKSGVSARLTISAYENMVSAAERRTLINDEAQTYIRLSDLAGILPAITGKVELVYEGEQEGAGIVAQTLVNKAIRTEFKKYFPDPDLIRKQKAESPYKTVTSWFEESNILDIENDIPDKKYASVLESVPGLKELVNKFHNDQPYQIKLCLMELVLHGLAEHSIISKKSLSTGLLFKDLLSSMFSIDDYENEADENHNEDDAY